LYSQTYPGDPGLKSSKNKNRISSNSNKYEKKSDTLYLQRVCNNEFFAEAVLINGVPKFLLANNETSKISIVDFIPLGKEDKIAMPLAAESYINKPYTFNSEL